MPTAMNTRAEHKQADTPDHLQGSERTRKKKKGDEGTRERKGTQGVGGQVPSFFLVVKTTQQEIQKKSEQNRYQVLSNQQQSR